MFGLRPPALGQEFPDSLVHFPRGLIRKGHTQNVLRRHATFGQVSDAISDYASFACPGSSQYQNRATDCFHSLPLLRIQGAQIQHRARSVMNQTGNPKSQNPNRQRIPKSKLSREESLVPVEGRAKAPEKTGAVQKLRQSTGLIPPFPPFSFFILFVARMEKRRQYSFVLAEVSAPRFSVSSKNAGRGERLCKRHAHC